MLPQQNHCTDQKPSILTILVDILIQYLACYFMSSTVIKFRLWLIHNISYQGILQEFSVNFELKKNSTVGQATTSDSKDKF